VKILIVDDEPPARERLLRLLSRVAPEADVVEAGNGAQALEQVALEQPDLLLLDIRMPVLDGIGVAAELRRLAEPPAVVFCTAYGNYALRALENQAVAYLMKPVREEELRAALERAGKANRLQLANLRGRRAARTHVVSATHRGVEMVALGEVRCFVAEQKYVRAVHPGGSLLISDTLKELQRELAGRFLRVHRNALVALGHIEGLKRNGRRGWLVALNGVEDLPMVSRRRLAEAKEKLPRV